MKNNINFTFKFTNFASYYYAMKTPLFSGFICDLLFVERHALAYIKSESASGNGFCSTYRFILSESRENLPKTTVFDLHFTAKNECFFCGRIEKRTYARREKTVEENDDYGRSKNVDMKIHVQQMRDDMPSAINKATPCPLVDDLLVLNEFEAGQPSKGRDAFVMKSEFGIASICRFLAC